MGKWISGELRCHIYFNDVYVEDGQDEIDAIFPDGWEGEMTGNDFNIIHEENEEDN